MLAVSLDYLRQSHEFVLKVAGVTKVEFTILYAFDRELTNADGAIKTEEVTEALTGSGTATDLGSFTTTVLAGTQSADQQVLHTPRKGALEIIATKATGDVTRYQATFTISATGQVEMLSQTEETAAEGQVAGVSTESALVAQAPRSTDSQTTQRLERPDQTVTTTAASTSLPLLESPLLIGGGLIVAMAVLGGVGWWWLRSRRLHLVHDSNSQ